LWFAHRPFTGGCRQQRLKRRSSGIEKLNETRTRRVMAAGMEDEDEKYTSKLL